jgi:hypothetical protein
MNTKQQELVESINKSLSSVFTKEDVLSIIKNFQDSAEEVKPKPAPTPALNVEILRSILCNIDLDDYIEKDITCDGSSIEFEIDTDSQGGNSFNIEVIVDESSVENAVEVEVSINDVDGLVQEILDSYANQLANEKVI